VNIKSSTAIELVFRQQALKDFSTRVDTQSAARFFLRAVNRINGANQMIRFKKLACVMVIGCATVATSPAAVAATDTTTFTVSASILSDCNLSATNLSFGLYDPAAGSPTDATSTVSVYCTTGLGYTLGLNVGTGGGSYTTRTLDSLGNKLNFNLYTSAARTTVWGDGTGATGTIAGTGLGLLSVGNHTVYGRMAAGQSDTVGVYASVVTVTVTF
jgi:spore coat protein U-like protein